MGKSIKLDDDVFWDASGIVLDGAGTTLGNAKVTTARLDSGTTLTFDINGSMAIFAPCRVALGVVGIWFFDYWSNAPQRVAGASTSAITITKTTNSYRVSIRNETTGTIPYILIGADVVV